MPRGLLRGFVLGLADRRGPGELSNIPRRRCRDSLSPRCNTPASDGRKNPEAALPYEPTLTAWTSSPRHPNGLVAAWLRFPALQTTIEYGIKPSRVSGRAVTQNLRRRLDQLGYRQPLGIESIPLVERLFSDLVHTTESLKNIKVADRPVVLARRLSFPALLFVGTLKNVIECFSVFRLWCETASDF